jgi:HSP20 family protein
MTYPERPNWDRVSARPRWDPFAQVQTLRAELGRLFGGSAGGGLLPQVEVDRDDEGWTVTARLPGVAPEEVAIDVDARELRIRVRSAAETEQLAGVPAEEAGEQPAGAPVSGPGGAPGGGPGAAHRNGARREFDYRLSLGGELDVDRVDATMDHGLLSVRLPRLTRTTRRQVTIGRRIEQPADRPPSSES